MIPYGRQHITQADIDAVVDVLQSDFLTQGPKVPAFERAVADRIGAKYAVAVNAGTSALHVACLALGLGPGDILWTSPITFVASANCALYCGARVDFVDIDPHTYTMCPKALEKKLEQAKKENRLPKIVVPVHLCGQSCNMKAIFDLSQKYGFKIIEDACHALGAEYKGSPVGNCRYSDITVFSFHPVKIITTGEGGMNTTNDADLASHMSRLCSHGITRDPDLMTHPPDGSWYYQQIDLGFNYRMTDIQAALGLSQLEKLDKFIARRRAIAKRYNQLLEKFPVITPWQDPDGVSAWHLYVIRLQLDKIRQTHQQVFVALREKGIGVNLHYIPVYQQPYYKQMNFHSGLCPQAEQYYSEAISIPIYPDLTEMQQNKIVTELQQTLKL
ncbi:UDP-4-amino-4,6-dideoxy-N-acetyl-beta-L-altrosamine transaminase [Desulfobacter hydrogenophilus]|uniref:UDP-4-amino-4, 6-dideoxy-N-acetyl-beta-L-altrosamine transaminase n=1 Tax=Desulfobacter hydrogenophilus TaxID=2291 RepID=A0A328FB00_9BACT|nr:UDP-4-amino-4,6-dideoxy-N-acetyl-beta-L-altrosamine transaminase [Desulfobacter hydrogenophilus]NDY73269.1 UDP-4-amino-4,6-dideoxy-N-acetyl-beta-L-altrosamine transaminase [Desulfobacter hydrogenophilus]QBH13845.1 UDP-4-amino-4,6-dideoxy-N-acetyl-beta-L-altrosamine transaminase [Desulfobacter hydrogenophilus]RAM00860.1 UDP-4-amino-4,6-dideoxy-N-acetyl-beta-L-altrosamine transaminase [Desulfobacter hydrogenophilus]